jgi:hypothetical protein
MGLDDGRVRDGGRRFHDETRRVPITVGSFLQVPESFPSGPVRVSDGSPHLRRRGPFPLPWMCPLIGLGRLVWP